MFNDICLYKCELDLLNLCPAWNYVCAYTHKCFSPVFQCYDDKIWFVNQHCLNKNMLTKKKKLKHWFFYFILKEIRAIQKHFCLPSVLFWCVVLNVQSVCFQKWFPSDSQLWWPCQVLEKVKRERHRVCETLQESPW